MKRDKKYYQTLYDLKSWQGLHVNQLWYTRNLVLVLSTASLGFTVTLLFDKNFTDCGEVIWTKISSGLLFASILAGILLAILESENYKLKYKIGRMIEARDDFETIPEDIDRQQRNCSRLEKINSVLIYIELFLFVVATTILTFTFF